MCANGVDLGHTCRLCGRPLLSCWDDGPSISWHADEADNRACLAVLAEASTEGDMTDLMHVPDRTCRIDWAVFGLESPAAGICLHPAVCLIVQGCPHEHVSRALACWHCLAYMRSLESLDRWGCAACLQGASGHQCRAPVLVRLLGAELSGQGRP